MDTIGSVKTFLEKWDNIGIWYAEYDGQNEEIHFVNRHFSETFGMPIEEILKRKRYHLVNPPDTPPEVIDQYKNEDREAMEKGYFVSLGKLNSGEGRIVLKLQFDCGIVGMFKTSDSLFEGDRFSLLDLDDEMRGILKNLRPDLI